MRTGEVRRYTVPAYERVEDVKTCDYCGEDATQNDPCKRCGKDLCQYHIFDGQVSGYLHHKGRDDVMRSAPTGIFCGPCLCKTIDEWVTGIEAAEKVA